MAKKSSPSLEQSAFSFLKQPKATTESSPVKSAPPQKKPFVPPLLQAIDQRDLSGNFMYLLRILINSANRQPNQPEAQKAFVKALLAEIKIKKGIGALDVETRTAILHSYLK